MPDAGLDMTRVTHLTASGEIGGAERVILECLRAHIADASVVTLAAGPLLRASEALGARAESVEPPPAFAAVGDAFDSSGGAVRAILPALPSLPAFFRRFARTVATLAPDVVHSHGIKTHVLSALLPRRAPVVWHLHDYVSTRPLSSKLMRLLARRCSLVIAVSESVAADARRVLPASVPVVAVHNGVDVTRFVPDGPALDLDAMSGLPPAPSGTIRIGLPATFARWKGHEVFLEAVARLGASPVRAYIIGAPVYQTAKSQWSRAELDAMVSRLDLSGRVGFTGRIDDMPAAYRSLDIVVHASTRPEPFGLVIAEAMACGRAVIAAPDGGAGELFTPGTHALAVPGADPAALAAAIGALSQNPDRRAVMGRAARLHSMAAFGRDRFAGNLQAALASLGPPR